MVMISEIKSEDADVGSLNGLGTPPSLPPGSQTLQAQPVQMAIQMRDPMDAGGAMTRPEGSFLDRITAVVKANPVLFAVGAAAVIGAFIFVPMLLKGMSFPGSGGGPVESMGLGAVKRKKRKSKKKSDPTHVCAYPMCTKGIRGDAEFCSKHKPKS